MDNAVQHKLYNHNIVNNSQQKKITFITNCNNHHYNSVIAALCDPHLLMLGAAAFTLARDGDLNLGPE